MRSAAPRGREPARPILGLRLRGGYGSCRRNVLSLGLAEFSIAESDARLGSAGPVDGRPRWGMRVCAKTPIVRPQVRRIDLQPEPIGTRSGWPALSNTL